MTQATVPLKDLQQWMRWILTQPEGPYAILKQEAGVAQEPLPRQVDAVLDQPPIDRLQRFSVYADAYFMRLLECLASDFKITRRCLGAETFARLIADYLNQHPSTSPYVGNVGRHLPGFVKTHALAKSHPYLRDLVQLEWFALESLYADRAVRFDPAAFATLDEAAWAEAKLIFDPTLHLLASRWPLHQCWEDEAFGASGMTERDTPLLVYRDADWIQVQALDAPQWQALEELARGMSLGAVCATLDAESTAKISAWLSDWVRRGLIAGIEI